MSKLKINIDPPLYSSDKEVRRQMSVEEIIEHAGADWDPSDPGVGRAVLLPDGREVFNPVPVAPPLGYVEGPSIFDQLYAKLRFELMAAKAEEAVDTAEEMNEFPPDEEPTFWTDYELAMREDFPEMPPEPDPVPVPPEIKEPAVAPAPPEDSSS